MSTNFAKYIQYSPEVKTALENKTPIVALESTIISHGFDYPQNLECALTCERIIRETGATPATIAIIGGVIKIGLSEEEINYLAVTKDIPKCSRRDISAIIARKNDGAATVATTMIFAQMAGIRVFATGGIGGVHRGAQETFDISADLEEFSQTNVAVICAGAKSILDIGLTLEYLETAGVSILGYKTEDFPSFYTRNSGYKVDYKINSAKEAAEIIKTKNDLGLVGGLLIANPIPEESALDSDFINSSINKAISEAKEQNITGKKTTPFLLGKLVGITAGKSVEANKALVFNNSKVAAEIAIELNKIK